MLRRLPSISQRSCVFRSGSHELAPRPVACCKPCSRMWTSKAREALKSFWRYTLQLTLSGCRQVSARLHDDGRKGSHRCLLEHHTGVRCGGGTDSPRVTLVCVRIMRSVIQMHHVQPKAIRRYRLSTRAACGLIVQQTTADPSDTNSPSAKTPNNDEAVRHGVALLRDSRCCSFRCRLRRMLQEKPHYISAITEECKQQSLPAKAQRTNPMISLDMPSGPTRPLSVTESKLSAVITNARALARYCLDFCACFSAHLSVAAIIVGLAVLVPLDADSMVRGETHDLTDPNVADYVPQLTWSGSIGLHCGSTPTQRLARRKLGQHETVAAKQQIDLPERHCHSHRRPRNSQPRSVGEPTIQRRHPLGFRPGFQIQRSYVLAMSGRLSV